jgi:hypothetical protein
VSTEFCSSFAKLFNFSELSNYKIWFIAKVSFLKIFSSVWPFSGLATGSATTAAFSTRFSL